jgi:hypothetical protein
LVTLVNRHKLTVLSYRGGHGGEFLIKFFHEQHPEFMPIGVNTDTAMNSYKIHNEFFIDNIKLSVLNTPHLIVKQHGFLDREFDNPAVKLLITSSNNDFNWFYFFLFTFKSELFMFNKSWAYDLFPKEFFQTLEHDVFFQWQYNSYENTGKIQTFNDYILDRFNNRWITQDRFKRNTNPKYNILLDELFFGNTSAEYQSICDFLNIAPTGNIEVIKEYHQRNTALVERWLGLSEADLRKLTKDQFFDILCDSSIRYMQSY